MARAGQTADGRPRTRAVRPLRVRSGDRRVLHRRLAAATVVVALTAVGLAGSRWWTRPSSRVTTIGVVRFDNETGNTDFDRFADALTDTVVAQLTASGQGRYEVIGNA